MAGEDPRYIEWTRFQPCILAGAHGCWGPIDPHHEPRRHGGKRTHDHTAIPACRRLHDSIQHPASLNGSPLAGFTVEQYMTWHRNAAEAMRRQYLAEEHDSPVPEGVF